MQAQTITIIGMQRLGVSVALALRAALPKVTLVGHDKDGSIAREVKEKTGAIDKVEWNLVRAAAQADILVLAVPFVELRDTLEAIGHDLQSHALLLDMSSLKGPGAKWAAKAIQSGHYVGVRPVLAAPVLEDGRTDYTAATADLFRNSVFCLMPTADVDARAVQTAVHFGQLLGSTPYFLDPNEYDSLIQGVETVPGLMAAAMYGAISKETGWRDMLRFANQPFALTTQPLGNGEDVAQLALYDQQATLRWLDAFLGELQLVRQWVQQGDRHSLTALLGQMGDHRAAWLRDRAQNDWAEAKMPTVENRGLTEQMLGSWVSERMGRDE